MPLLNWLLSLRPKPYAVPTHPHVGSPLKPTLLEQLRGAYPDDDFTIPPHPASPFGESPATAEAVAQPESRNMGILTDLRAGKITWSQAASEIVAWGESVIKGDPTLTTAVGAVVSNLKQAASDAVTDADGAFSTFIGPATGALETGLEAALAGYTKGVSLTFNPLITDTIDKIEAAAVAEANAWALKAKAALATPAAS